MADVFTRWKRSEVMSKIRAKGNKGTEIALMKLLRTNHISGWRRHVLLKFDPDKVKPFDSLRKLQVLVDFVFKREKVALFVDGCFWHGCPKHFNRPVNNGKFWMAKLEGNVTRDHWVNKMLRVHGWKVVRIWEHELEMAAFKERKAGKTRVVEKIKKTISMGSGRKMELG